MALLRINGDVAVLKGIMKEMLAMDEASGGKVLDRFFINEKTHGFEEFAADIRNKLAAYFSRRA